MFEIGASIAYPMHGAGTILNIEEKEVLGEKHDYYYVNLPHSKMTVMIPVSNSAAVGVRPIISKEEIPAVLDVLSAPSDPMPGNWNRRYRDNTEKLRTRKDWSPEQNYYANYLRQGHGRASDCIGCRTCEKTSPQHIKISEHMQDVFKVLEENNSMIGGRS